MVVITLLLLKATFETRSKIVCSVGRGFRTKQVERHAEVKVQITLQRSNVDGTVCANIIGVMFLGELHASIDDPRNSRCTNEHMVRLFTQHKITRSRKRIKCGFTKRCQLEFAVAVGEIRKQKERKPIRCRLVKRPENPRTIGVTRMTLQHFVGLITTVTTKVAMQQVHHGPQVAAFFHVDLEQVAKVIQARCGHT